MTETEEIVQEIADILLDNKWTLSVAESCTGGLISSLLTDIPGSSHYTKINFVTYCAQAKEKYLSVKSSTLKKFGEVSEQVAKEMALGVIKKTKADFALSTTGIAGNSGGYLKQHAGLIYIGVASRKESVVYKFNANPRGSRRQIKSDFANMALKLFYSYLKEQIHST